MAITHCHHSCCNCFTYVMDGVPATALADPSEAATIKPAAQGVTL
jgi:hypothetical protein